MTVVVDPADKIVLQGATAIRLLTLPDVVRKVKYFSHLLFSKIQEWQPYCFLIESYTVCYSCLLHIPNTRI